MYWLFYCAILKVNILFSMLLLQIIALFLLWHGAMGDNAPTAFPTFMTDLETCPPYSRSYTSSANTNYAVCDGIELCFMDTLTIGQCFDVTLGSGDQYIRLVKNDTGVMVTENDDTRQCGPYSSSLLSRLVYQRTESGCGSYALREGCYSYTACSGTIMYQISKVGTNEPSSQPSVRPTFVGETLRPTRAPTTVSPSAIPTPAPSERPTFVLTPYPSRQPSSAIPSPAPSERPTFVSTEPPSTLPSLYTSCPAYSASSTNSANYNFMVCEGISLCQLDRLTIGQCFTPSLGRGDQYIRLVEDATGSIVASNDDSSCGLLSKIEYSRSSPGCGTYTLREGCFAQYSCGGTMQYVVTTPTYTPTEFPSSSIASPSEAPTTTRPSARPTAHPSAVPTVVPTKSLQGRWIEKTEEMLLQLESSGADTFQASFAEVVVEGVHVTGSGLPSWTAFVSSVLPVMNIENVPVSVRVMTVTSLEAEQFDVLASCSDDSSALQSIMGGQLTGPHTNIICGNSSWAIIQCSSSANSYCVDCAPVNTSELCSISSAFHGLVPTGSGMGTNQNANHTFLHVFVAEYRPRSSAPLVSSIGIVDINSRNATLRVVLSGPGSVFCKAYANLAGQSTFADVVASGTFGRTDGNISLIVLPNLVPATYYQAICATFSQDLVPLTTEMFAAQPMASFETDCCKTVLVSSNLRAVTEFSQVANAVSITLSAHPIGTVNASLVVVDAPSALFFPSFLLFSGSSLTGSFSFMGTYEGDKTIELHLSGPDSVSFSVVFARNRSFAVVTTPQPTPPPVLISAAFASSGSYVRIEFDSPTDKSGIDSTGFDCCLIFDFSGGDCAAPTCMWLDRSTIRMVSFPDTSGSLLEIGDRLTVRAGVLKARCESTDTGFCTSFEFSPGQSIEISAPARPVSPSVQISSAGVIGSCLDLSLSLSSSTGHGGRAWASRSFVVTNQGAPAFEIERFLNENFTFVPPTVVPHVQFQTGTSYVISATLCNFLGICGSSSKSIVVLDNVIPSVSIMGANIRTVHTKNALSLYSDAFVAQCDGSRSTKFLSYDWSISVESESQASISIVSTSIDPTVFRLAPFSLIPNTVYSVSAVVSSSSSNTQATSSVTVIVVPGAIVSIIAGGGIQSLLRIVGQTLILDASNSFDEDSSLTTLTYRWTCTQSTPTFTSICPFDIVWANNGTSFSVGYGAETLSTAVATVEVTVDDISGRSSTASVAVNSVPANTPSVSIISSHAAPTSSQRQLTIEGSVVHSAPVGARAEWSCDYPGLDLANVALTGVSLDFPLTMAAVTYSANLVLPTNSLPSSTVIVFTLTAFLDSGDSHPSSTTTTVTTSGPPVPGVLLLSPSSGVELVTKFSISADLWSTDTDDVVLSYEFGFISTSESFISLQARSESTQYSGSLPAGAETNQNALTVRVIVYDSSDSFTVLDTVAEVSPTELSDDGVSEFASVQLGDAGDANSVSQVIGTTSEYLNAISCSDADTAFCAGLNRLPCGVTEQTCGACLVGFVGLSGDSNNICTSAERRTRILVADFPTCLNDCSGRGVCTYRDKNTYESVSQCNTGSTECVAVCECNFGFFGRDCSYLSSTLLTRQENRLLLLRALANNTFVQNVNDQTVVNWISQLNGLTQKPEELSGDALRVAADVLSAVLASLPQTTLPPSIASGALTSIDRILFVLFGYSNNFFSGPQSSSAIAQEFHQLMDLFTESVTLAMVPGQHPITSYFSEFTVTSRLGINNNEEVSFVTVGTSDTVSVSEVISHDLLYGANTAHLSRPLHVDVKGKSCSEDSSALACEITVHLENFRRFEEITENPLVIDTTCEEGSSYVHSVVCSPTFSEEVTCPGFYGVIRSQCPVSAARPVCVELSGDDEIAGSCSLTSFSDSATVCQCNVAGASLYAGSGFQRTYVATSETYQEPFVSTFHSSAPSFAPTAAPQSFTGKNRLYFMIGFGVLALAVLYYIVKKISNFIEKWRILTMTLEEQVEAGIHPQNTYHQTVEDMIDIDMDMDLEDVHEEIEDCHKPLEFIHLPDLDHDDEYALEIEMRARDCYEGDANL